MTKRMHFVWIDDDSSRQRMATNIRKTLGVPVIFVNVKHKEPLDELNRLFQSEPPDLVIVDHFLNLAKGMITAGSTVAEVVRERWPSVPIVGVTGDAKLPKVHARNRSMYDELFSLDYLLRSEKRLIVIAKGFALLSKAAQLDVEALIRYLKPPKIEKKRILGALPDDLKGIGRLKPDDKTLFSRFYKWVSGELLAAPGLLYDALWSATRLGLNELGFRKVGPTFDQAKYRGIFAFSEEPRWWVARLDEILYRNTPSEEPAPPWMQGAKLTRISKRELSRCYVCKKPCPEIVAYVDEGEDADRHPMHLRCTESHPGYRKMVFFEEIRMMKEPTCGD